MAARPLRRYERFHANASHWSSGFREQVEAKLAGGWPSDGEVLPSLAPPILWNSANRPFAANLHAWWPLALLFQAHSQFRETRYVEQAWPFARDWIASFWRPLAALPEQDAVEAALACSPQTEAWYDMAVGLRIYRLAYLFDVACRDPERTDEEVGELAAALAFHHRLLAESRLFKGHNNHGVFQALGQLAAARRIPELAGDHGERAAERLRGCVRSQFFESGVHREHSPGYHQALLKVLIGARDDGLLAPADLDWIARAEEALGWMIAPNAGLAPIGDTDRKWFNLGGAFVRRFADPTVRTLLSRGRLPGEVRLGVRAYPDAGYVFARLPPEGGEAPSTYAYLAQIAGFHSRTHKHADHLSFVWWDRGFEILTDPGRFAYLGKTRPGSPAWRDGFWYADPRRIFVERTRAHNAVEVDGRDHSRAGVPPFGSALVSVDECDGTVLTECAFTGEGDLRFRRVLALRPGRFLLVIDEVADGAGESHEFRQWFTLAPGWSAEPDEGGLLAKRDGGGADVLRVVSLADGATLEGPWRGQETPELLGWVAETPNRLAPATAFALRRDGASAGFATLFTFCESTRPGPPAAAPAADDEARFCWREAGRDVTLTLNRDDQGRLQCVLVED